MRYRVKGKLMCDYCLHNKEISNDGGFENCKIRIDADDKEIVFIVNNSNGDDCIQSAIISYCPMCGQAL
jgi:hypothetical protein